MKWDLFYVHLISLAKKLSKRGASGCHNTEMESRETSKLPDPVALATVIPWRSGGRVFLPARILTVPGSGSQSVTGPGDDFVPADCGRIQVKRIWGVGSWGLRLGRERERERKREREFIQLYQ